MSSREIFGRKAQEQFDDLGRWSGWVEVYNGALYSTHDKVKEDHRNRYCLDRKAYWSYPRAIWAQLSDDAQRSGWDSDIWMENIAWSNLYKASPKNGGNPDSALQAAQLSACKMILKEELLQYEPTHILMMTGFDWFVPFADIFENVCDSGKRNILRGASKNEVYVEGTASFKDAKVVITCRPEWRTKESFVSAVLSAFQG